MCDDLTGAVWCVLVGHLRSVGNESSERGPHNSPTVHPRWLVNGLYARDGRSAERARRWRNERVKGKQWKLLRSRRAILGYRISDHIGDAGGQRFRGERTSQCRVFVGMIPAQASQCSPRTQSYLIREASAQLVRTSKWSSARQAT